MVVYHAFTQNIKQQDLIIDQILSNNIADHIKSFLSSKEIILE